MRAIDSSGRESGWSKTEKLTVRFPETEFTVPLGATVKTVREILGRAVERSPAVVHFDPGEYRFDPDGAEALLPLVGASDLIVDGHGASITLTGQCNIVKLWDSQNVLVRLGGADGRDDALPDPGQDGLFAGAAHQAVDVGP